MSITAPTGIERVEPMEQVARTRFNPIPTPAPRPGSLAEVRQVSTPARCGVPGSHIAIWVVAGTVGWVGIIAGGNWLLHVAVP